MGPDLRRAARRRGGLGQEPEEIRGTRAGRRSGGRRTGRRPPGRSGRDGRRGRRSRVDRKTASATECVTKSAVKGSRSRRASRSSFSRSRVISSREPKGSSRRRSRGETLRARAMETRIRMPPESCQGNLSRGVGQADEFEQVLAPGAPARPRRLAAELERKFDVGGDPPPGQQARVLEDEEHPRPAPPGRRRHALPCGRRRSARRSGAGGWTFRSRSGPTG